MLLRASDASAGRAIRKLSRCRVDTARQLSIAETEPNGSVADPQFFGNLTKARAVGAQHPYLVSVHDTRGHQCEEPLFTRRRGNRGAGRGS
jgi:hypothetical protein